MEIMSQSLNSRTVLHDRILTFDGDTIIKPDEIVEFMLENPQVTNICTTEMTPDIQTYNKSVINKIDIKGDIRPFDFTYNIPDEYKSLNILEHVIKLFINKHNVYDEKRFDRLKYEMAKFKQNGLYDFLRLLVYVQDVITDNNIVKGVGRGSSVSSYVLYVIGIHIIDAYKYDLDFSEFIKE